MSCATTRRTSEKPSGDETKESVVAGNCIGTRTAALILLCIAEGLHFVDARRNILI